MPGGSGTAGPAASRCAGRRASAATDRAGSVMILDYSITSSAAMLGCGGSTEGTIMQPTNTRAARQSVARQDHHQTSQAEVDLARCVKRKNRLSFTARKLSL